MSRDRAASNRIIAVRNEGKSRLGGAPHLPKAPRRATFGTPI